MGVSSALWVISPYIRKLLVDAMTKTIEASIAGTGVSTSIGILGRIKQALLVGSEVKGGLSLAKFIAGLGFYGLCKITASFIYQKMIYQQSKFLYKGLRKLYTSSFAHLHRLDIGFHRNNSKQTLFEINEAIRSLERGLYYILANNLWQVMNMSLILIGMKRICGTKYFLLTLATFVLQFAWVINYSKKILPM